MHWDVQQPLEHWWKWVGVGLRLAQSLGCMTDQDWDDGEEKNKALGGNIENPVIRINNISVQYLKYQNGCKKNLQ